ncbi:hypothetical protein WAH63_22105, partial [Acinetobacter baumannii]
KPKIGFGDAIKQMLNTPPIPKETKTKKVGNVIPINSIDRWLNKIHCGDNLDIVNQLPEKSVGLIVTSPPF